MLPLLHILFLNHQFAQIHDTYLPSNTVTYLQSGVLPQNMRSGRNLKAGMKCTCLGSKLFGSRWPLKLRRCRSCRKICSVCLEGFQDKQQIAKLSCSHKFHLDCVLPWLAAHPHCPYCRTPVLVSWSSLLSTRTLLQLGKAKAFVTEDFWKTVSIFLFKPWFALHASIMRWMQKRKVYT